MEILVDGAEARERLAAQVVLAQEGQRNAFEQVVKLTEAHTRKIAYSIVGPDHCEDVLQESYLLVFRKLKQVSHPQAFMGWLCRLVLHVAYRYHKMNPTNHELPEHIVGGDQPEQMLDALVLRRALAGMHHKDRDVLILRELLGLSYEEVARALQLPVGTVRSRLHKARARLAERLKRRAVE